MHHGCITTTKLQVRVVPPVCIWIGHACTYMYLGKRCEHKERTDSNFHLVCRTHTHRHDCQWVSVEFMDAPLYNSTAMCVYKTLFGAGVTGQELRAIFPPPAAAVLGEYLPLGIHFLFIPLPVKLL